MRALLRHARTYSVAEATFHINKVNMHLVTTATNRRDIFLHAFGRDAGAVVACYAFGTLAQAHVAITGVMTAEQKTAAGVLAYQDSITLQGADQTVTMTDNAGTSPDLTGLTIGLSGAGSATSWDSVYAYSAGVAGLVIDEIENVLDDYVGAGQSLYGFTAAQMVKGPEGLIVLSICPHIIAAIADRPNIAMQANHFAVGVNFVVVVGDRGITDQGQTTYVNVMNYAEQVASILGDQNLTLNGVCPQGVSITGVEGPSMLLGADEGAAYYAAKVYGIAQFPVLESDRS